MDIFIDDRVVEGGGGGGDVVRAAVKIAAKGRKLWYSLTGKGRR